MTKLHATLLFVAVIVGAPATWARAQHEGHQMSAAGSTSPPNGRCAEAGRKALALVAATDTWSAEAAGRDASRELAELQRVVSAAQAELFTCKAAVHADVRAPQASPMAGMDHSTMNMGTPAPGAKLAAAGAKADPMAGMDHSKMNMRTPAAGAKPVAGGVKPAARGAKPADPMAGRDHSKMNLGTPAPKGKPASPGTKPPDPMARMDHSKMNTSPAAGADPPAPGTASETGAAAPAAATPGGGAGKLPVMMAQRIADPACPDTVGQATAPKAVFERKVYFFCSVAARDQFRKDPAAYLKKHPR